MYLVNLYQFTLIMQCFSLLSSYFIILLYFLYGFMAALSNVAMFLVITCSVLFSIEK